MRSVSLNFKRHCPPLLALLAGVFWCDFSFAQSPATKPLPGLTVSFTASDKSDVTAKPNVWLYVPAGKSPTPFLSGEKITAVWEGFLSVDLRGDYAFQAELNGHLKLEINGALVLETSETNSGVSKPIRLSKGTNAFRATFDCPTQGDAFVRLNWKPKDSFLQPIPSTAFSHFSSVKEQIGEKLRLGRELFVEHRCLKCHVSSANGMPELAMDAPSFEEIGSRRNGEWLARWIAHPKELRDSAQMPQIFSDDLTTEKAEAAVAFLSSLKNQSVKPTENEPTPKQSAVGKKLFATLHCTACHNAPDNAKIDAGKISLKQVRAKFAAGALVDFLKQPDLHYAWIRMPTFKLSDEQREQLAAYLISNADQPEKNFTPANATQIELGQKLVQTSGCLNCHSLKLDNQFSTKTLAQISDWNAGCLAEKHAANSQAPQFNFSGAEREALQLFAATDRSSLSRHVPSEFAERQTRVLNCVECHNKIENIPRFEILGGKLKPEWSAKFIAGKIAYKPRPWIDAQMPSFSKRATLLAEGLAMEHGFAPHTADEPPIDLKAAEIGRNLVSIPPLGFSCVACHAVGEVGTTQVFESPGINLAHTGERLLPSFFKRWLLSPQLVDPISKMPTYFDEEGKSPLTDVYDGDGEKQIDAIWQYVRLGAKMPAPKTE